ncbi:hypothetical protein NP493_2g20005 [Ridgeia piscesae]|uniref:Secreted protein n=1 Tax=Ridgeia piscesae TaxID=27915 RepID=A0AAD9PGC4_RIDPI|nr:hypothetical protein NP493_2g20005 [Ridgeia piscesae]
MRTKWTGVGIIWLASQTTTVQGAMAQGVSATTSVWAATAAVWCRQTPLKTTQSLCRQRERHTSSQRHRQ